MALGLGPKKPDDPDKSKKPAAAAPPPEKVHIEKVNIEPGPQKAATAPEPEFAAAPTEIPAPRTVPLPFGAEKPNANLQQAPAQRRTLTIGVTVAIYVIAAFFVWGIVAFLSSRYKMRPLDLTHQRTFTLATETRQLLKRLSQPLRITAIYRRAGEDRQRLFNEIGELVDLFKVESSLVSFQRLDPDRDPSALRELLTRTKVDSSEDKYNDSVVFEYGTRAALVPKLRIVEVETVKIGNRLVQQAKAFHGEFAFASALLNLLEDQIPVVDFVQGHNELDLEGSDSMGLMHARDLLREEKMKVRQLFLLEKLKIPDDTSVIVIAGPSEQFMQPEIAQLEKFLTRGGGLLLFCEPGSFTGLESLLSRYGVALGANRIFDLINKKVGASAFKLLINTMGKHLIVNPLANAHFTVPNARTIDKLPANPSLNPKLVRTELLWTSDSAWGETDLNNPKPAMNPEMGDRKGPLSMAMSVEIPPDAADPQSASRGGTRMVIVGSRDIFTNYTLRENGANGDLFQNIINWLSKRDRLTTARPKSPDRRPLQITEEQAKSAALFAYLGIPGLLALAGIFIWWRRRA
ncbi:MAG: GldG family protein [Planctomycetota bacterium]